MGSVPRSLASPCISTRPHCHVQCLRCLGYLRCLASWAVCAILDGLNKQKSARAHQGMAEGMTEACLRRARCLQLDWLGSAVICAMAVLVLLSRDPRHAVYQNADTAVLLAMFGALGLTALRAPAW